MTSKITWTQQKVKNVSVYGNFNGFLVDEAVQMVSEFLSNLYCEDTSCYNPCPRLGAIYFFVNFGEI